MGVVTFVRGLPGSGKTAYANKLAKERGIPIIEPDSFLIENGKYSWSSRRWSRAENIACNMLQQMGAMGSDCIYADVLPSLAEVSFRYYDYCLFSRGKNRFEIIDMPLLNVFESMERNTRGIRKSVIEDMIKRWMPKTLMEKTKEEDRESNLQGN